MKPEFDETYRSEQHDPLQEECAGFDWDGVCAGLGEPVEQADPEKLALALRRVFQWLLQVDYNLTASPLTPDTLIGRRLLALALRRLLQWMLQVDYNLTASPLMPDTLIGRRVVALAWVTNPDLFPDRPSLRQLSRQLGVMPSILAALTGEVCREFGIQNRAQDHAWNRNDGRA